MSKSSQNNCFPNNCVNYVKNVTKNKGLGSKQNHHLTLFIE
jgi:hypothetical protein